MAGPRSHEVDAQIDRAREVMARISSDYAGAGAQVGRRVRRRARSAVKKLQRVLLANALVLLAALVAGWFRVRSRVRADGDRARAQAAGQAEGQGRAQDPGRSQVSDEGDDRP